MKKAAIKFKYKIGQLLWTHHKIFGWVRGKVESKWEFDGRPHYRVIVRDPDDTVEMITTATEQHFFKEKGDE